MFNPEQRRYLLDLARRAIVHGLEQGAPPALDLSSVEPDLRRLGACFVTLEIQGRLRGCIGMLEPVRPLAEDVAQNAYAAAFSDSRFPPLQAGELEGLDIHVSVLGAPAAMEIASEADLLRQLRPGVDGLILQEGGRRATFLPSVWESLPEPSQFVAHLKQKAGWPAGYWSPGIRAFRYETEQFG